MVYSIIVFCIVQRILNRNAYDKDVAQVSVKFVLFLILILYYPFVFLRMTKSLKHFAIRMCPHAGFYLVWFEALPQDKMVSKWGFMVLEIVRCEDIEFKVQSREFWWEITIAYSKWSLGSIDPTRLAQGIRREGKVGSMYAWKKIRRI